MTKLTVSNASVTNTTTGSTLSFSNNSIDTGIALGSVTVNTSQLTIGSSIVNTTAVSVPLLTLGGVGFSGSLGGIINYQEFTANGTWYNPYANASVNAAMTGNETVFVMMWGGGGGGYTAGTGSGGGGGGACVIFNSRLSDIANTSSITVGPGGVRGATGGNTVFVINSSSTITAYGGGFGTGTISGGGGGWYGIGIDGSTGVGGGPLGGNSSVISSTFGGSYGGASVSYSIFGGAGGGGGSTSTNLNQTIYGGGGGAGGAATIATANGTVFGGRGGNTSSSALAPGGGGNSLSGNTGGRGEVRVWVIK